MLKILAVLASLALLGGIPAQAAPQPAVDTAMSAHARLQLAGNKSKSRSKKKSRKKGSKKTYYQPQVEGSLSGDSVRL
jgi:hypothetical protein